MKAHTVNSRSGQIRHSVGASIFADHSPSIVHWPDSGADFSAVAANFHVLGRGWLKSPSVLWLCLTGTVEDKS